MLNYCCYYCCLEWSNNKFIVDKILKSVYAGQLSNDRSTISHAPLPGHPVSAAYTSNTRVPKTYLTRKPRTAQIGDPGSVVTRDFRSMARRDAPWTDVNDRLHAYALPDRLVLQPSRFQVPPFSKCHGRGGAGCSGHQKTLISHPRYMPSKHFVRGNSRITYL